MGNKIFVVGSNAEQLAQYLREKGSFNIRGVSKSLAADKERLMTEATLTDKLVIVMNDPNMRFMAEYTALRDLTLDENLLFRYTDLFLFVRSDDKELAGYPEWLETLYSDVLARGTIPEITIHLIQDREEYSLELIYSTIIGHSEITGLENSYITRVRKPKGDPSRYSYQPQDTSEYTIKPYSYSGIIMADEVRKNAVISDDGRRFVEAKKKERTSYPDLPKIKAREIDKGSVILIVGEPNSGKSLLGASLSLAASINSYQTLLIDMKKETDYPKIFRNAFRNEVPFAELEMSDIIAFRDGKKNQYKHSIIAQEHVNHLTYILKRLKSLPFSNVIVEIERDQLEQYWGQIGRFVGLTIFTSTTARSDIEKLKEYVEIVDNPLISLTDYTPRTNFEKYLLPKDIKRILGNDVKLMTPMRLEKLEVPVELFRLILGVMEDGSK